MSKIALYIRLSVEDRLNIDESESIVNQRLYLRDFVSKNKEFKIYEVEEYVDDGYSGMNEKRPAFQKMLEDVKAGLVKVIIVKDLSRFMRDYIAIGDYLENIFPFLGVRFISINDGYDSQQETGNGTELDVQFKSLLYDFYSKDTSEKIISVTNAMRKQGKFLSALAPFGYMKDPNDKHKIIIDEKTAWIVKKIYSLALDGVSIGEITRTLNRESIIVPSERKRELSASYKGQNNKKMTWTQGTVLSILRNENYTGTYVYNRKAKNISTGGKAKNVPKEKWCRVYDNHEAIISIYDFEKVQEIKAKRRFIKGTNKDYKWYVKSPLQGFLRCSICNNSLACVKNETETKTKGNTILRYFYCRTCRGNSIYGKSSKADILEEQVFAEIKTRFDIEKEKTKPKVNAKVLENNIEKLKIKKMNVFEKYKLGKISKDKFKNEKLKIENEIYKLEEQIKLSRFEVQEEIKGDVLTREMVEKYIDFIICSKNKVESITWK